MKLAELEISLPFSSQSFAELEWKRKSSAQGAVLGAGLREATVQDFLTSNHALGRGQKEKVCDSIQVPREAQKIAIGGL